MPFTGITGNFNFWKEENRQKYLSTNAAYKTAASDATTYACAATRAALTATTATFANATYNAAVCDVAAHAVHAIYATNAADVAAYAAYAVDIYASCAAAPGYNNIDLKPFILSDFETIQKKESAKNISTDFYGEIWNNFLKALAAEGCVFWGELYKNIFNNGLKANLKDAKRRMSVPKKIQEQGAAVVAKFLQEIE